MRYQSPASLFGKSLPRPLDKKSIQLEKKRLLADLELAGDQPEAGGMTLSRNDIINYFDELLKDNIGEFHGRVEVDNTLLVFLETSTMQRDGRFADDPRYKDIAFLDWISPYFHTAFAEAVDNALKGNDDDTFFGLFRNEWLMNAQHMDQSWIEITNSVTSHIDYLEHARVRYEAGDRSEVNGIEVVRLMDFRLSTVLRLLPETKFGPLRDKFALAVMRVCIVIFNKKMKSRSHIEVWMENARLSASSDEMKRQISAKLDEMNNIADAQANAPSGATASTGSKGSGRAILGIIVFIVFIFRACASLSSSHSYAPPAQFSPDVFRVQPANGANTVEAPLPPVVVYPHKKKPKNH